MLRVPLRVVTAIACLLAAPWAMAAEPKTKVKSLILPGESFLVAGRPAFILLPPKEKRTMPQPWVMYSPTLPAYPDKHEKWMHEQFIDAGVAVAGIDVGEAYGSPKSQELISALYEELTNKRSFAAKPCLLGRSRGGLWASSWAIANPSKVAGLAGIYPVFDLRTYPGLNRAAPAYGLTPDALEQNLETLNPVSRLDVLAKAKIPVCIIHGDSDTVVPLDKNSATLKKTYAANDAEDLVELIVAEGQGHNFWEGFFHCQEVVDFAIARAKGSDVQTEEESAQADEDSPAKPAGPSVLKDIEYSQAGDLSLKMDLYLPAERSGPLPVVMWVHGGGWKNGSKNRCPGTWLIDHGFAVASINYRLTHQGQWPAQIDDCRAAVRFLRANAEKYGLDGDHIAAFGGSAGGHLVAVLGTLDAPKDEKISSRVQAVCDWYGPTDLLTMPPNVVGNGRTEKDVANSNGAKLLGSTVRDVPELAKQASAFWQVSADDPPFLIMHGDKDPGVPLVQSEKLHAKLKEAGVPSKLYVIKGAGHGGKQFQSPEAKAVILEFFEKNLQGK